MRPGQRSFVWASGFPEARAAYPETATGRRWHTKYTAFPYLALLRVGFAKPARYRTAGALLPHLFTLTGDEPRRYIFCGTFRPLRALELRGTLPCGVRTFLSLFTGSDHPSACRTENITLY